MNPAQRTSSFTALLSDDVWRNLVFRSIKPALRTPFWKTTPDFGANRKIVKENGRTRRKNSRSVLRIFLVGPHVRVASGGWLEGHHKYLIANHLQDRTQ